MHSMPFRIFSRGFLIAALVFMAGCTTDQVAQLTAKWFTTSYHPTVEEAEQRYGECNYEVLEWSKEVRDVGDPLKLSAAHVQRGE